MKRFSKILTLEGGLLLLAGLTHIIYLIFFVDFAVTDTVAYAGGMFFGIAYTFIGIRFIGKKTGYAVARSIYKLHGLNSRHYRW